jgi:hypothetical protein
MAGQGVNLGYSDVQCLTRCLKEAAEQGQDLGIKDSYFIDNKLNSYVTILKFNNFITL